MAKMDEDAPMCQVCNHRHHQGKKCPICGHKGKGKIYQLLAEGPVSMGLNFRLFDRRTSEQWFKGYWALAHIIRRRVYCTEMKVDPMQEFDEDDPISRHVLIQVGDAPVGYARWHFETGPPGSGQKFALVDRMCVLGGYRKRGFARACMERIIKDVSSNVAELKLTVAAIVVPVPASSFSCQKLSASGFSQQGDPFNFRGVPYIRMYLLSNQELSVSN